MPELALGRRDFIKSVGGGIAAILAGSTFPFVTSCSLTRRRPNVVYILLDALRADGLRCYGYHRNTSPNIDKLAAEGTLIDELEAGSSATLRSAPVLLSSEYAPSHDPSFDWHLSCDFTTFPEIYRDAGYDTQGYCTNPLVYCLDWCTKGFNNFAVPHAYPDEGISFHHSRAYTKAIHEQGLVQNGKVKEPFFWLFWLYQPHSPYDAPEPYNNMWLESRKGQHPEEIYRDPLKVEKLDQITPEDVEHTRALYDSNTASGDEFVGTIVEMLAGLGIMDRTLIVVSSDHGEGFYEHQLFSHPGHVYREFTRIPWIMRGPGVPRGKRVKGLVSMVDEGPTMLELTGHGRTFGCGRSIVPLMRGEASPPHRTKVFSDYFGTAMTTYRDRQKWRLICYNWEVGGADKVWRKGWKLLQQGKPHELYNISADPFEQNDLAPERPELVEELEGYVRAYFEEAAWKGNPDAPAFDFLLVDQVHRGAMTILQRGDQVTMSEVGAVNADFPKNGEDWADVGKQVGGRFRDPEVMERLRALGYVGTTQ